MLTIRPVQWPEDTARLCQIDTSFVTDRIYRPVWEELSFRLEEQPTHPPLSKRYEFQPSDPQEREQWDCVAVAEDEGEFAGVVAAQYVAWNQRVVIHHLYVHAPGFRRRGIGTLLLAAADTFARSCQARCLWLETQNVNYPAIRFYRTAGFRFCGFDASLYPPESLEQEEIALFFARSIIPTEDVYHGR